MRFDSLKSRLHALERKSGASEMTLRFPDGSTQAVRVRDPLGALCDAFRREYARTIGEPEPISKHDGILDLMAGADGIEGDSDPFLILLQETAKGYEVKQ